MSTPVRVLEICLPIFAIIGLGVILRWRSWMSAEQSRFLAWFVNNICLPALIFSQTVQCDVSTMQFQPLLWPVLLGVFGPVLLVACFLPFVRLPLAVAAPMLYATYWANTAYMGIPLSESGWGTPGVQYTALMNAFAIPIFAFTGVTISFLLARRQAKDGEHHSAGKFLRHIALHPFVLSCILGLLAAVILHAAPIQTFLQDSGWVSQGLRMTGSTLDKAMSLLGHAGIGLALVAIGFGLRFEAIRAAKLPLTISITAKLLISPLLAYLVWHFGFPNADKATGIVVMQLATPTAVAAYVIGHELGHDEGFLSAHLVLATLLSCLTIPLWLLLLI
jgi:predicted permease